VLYSMQCCLSTHNASQTERSRRVNVDSFARTKMDLSAGLFCDGRQLYCVVFTKLALDHLNGGIPGMLKPSEKWGSKHNISEAPDMLSLTQE